MKAACILLALIWAGNTFAQTQKTEKPPRPKITKGSGIVSADIPFGMGFTFSKNPLSGNGANTQEFAIKPQVSGGYFLANNFMVGAGFGVYQGWSRFKAPLGPVNHQTWPTFLLPALQLRYYVMFSEKVGFYAQLTGEPMIQANGPVEQFMVAATLSPKLVFFPKPAWGINAGFGEVGYMYSEYYPNGNTNDKSIVHDITVFPFMSVGASYYIRKNKS